MDKGVSLGSVLAGLGVLKGDIFPKSLAELLNKSVERAFWFNLNVGVALFKTAPDRQVDLDAWVEYSLGG